MTECEQANAEGVGGQTDDDLRTIMRDMVPQGVEAFEDILPPDGDDVSTSDVVVHGLWQPVYPWQVGECDESQKAA